MFNTIIILFILFALKPMQCSVEVDTDLGKVIGFNAEFDGKMLDVFYGIPYGEPPVGVRRFRNSTLVKKFKSDPFIATKFTAHCPIRYEKVLEGAPIQEDCLHLNIWRPSNDAKHAEKHSSIVDNDDRSENSKTIRSSSQKSHNQTKCTKMYPVLVYFYGGVGSIFMLEHHKQEWIAYDGAPLAMIGDMIVVTVNYRSGPFGNLWIPGKIPANAGFFDQALSIQFVNKHIHSFCGDSNRITIFGNSLGSISVGFNLLSSYSNKYFQQAIMQSASPVYNQFTPDTPEETYEKSIQFAEDVGCVQTRFGKKYADIKCLQEVPLEKTQEFMIGFEHFPSLAGDFFNVKSKLLYKTVDVLNIPKDKRILIGLVSNEICFGGLEYLLTRKFDKDDSPPYVSKREAQKSILARLALIGDFNTKEMLKITDFYTRRERNYTFPYYDALDALASDIAFNCPVNFFAQSAAKRLPVYSYVITKKPKTHYINAIPNFNFTGVCHADDLNWLFGQAFKNEVFFDDTDREFSRQLIKVFADFVHSGKPTNLTNSEAGEWPTGNWKQKELNYVELSLNKREVRNFDLENRCDDLWWKMHRKLLREPTPVMQAPPKSDLMFFTIFFAVIIVLLIVVALVERYFVVKKIDYEKF